MTSSPRSRWFWLFRDFYDVEKIAQLPREHSPRRVRPWFWRLDAAFNNAGVIAV